MPVFRISSESRQFGGGFIWESNEMNFIDLSHQIIHGMPTYTTDPDVFINKLKNIKDDRSLLHEFSMGTHTGTHLDVPAHIIEGGKTLEDFPLSRFSGRAIKVEINRYKDLDNIYEKIDGIILDTGWYNNFNNPEVYYGSDRPEIPAELLEIILSKKVRIFGCDLPSVDVSGRKEKPIHEALFGADIIIYESLTNLEKLPSLMPFDFYGFPLPFVGLDGSPVRAVANI